MSFFRRDCGDTLAGKGMARRPVENNGRKRTCHNADVPGKVNAQEWCKLTPRPDVKDSLRFSFRARPSYPNSIADLCTWLWSCVRHSKRCIWGRSFSPNASGNSEPPLQAIPKFHYVSSAGH